MSHVECPHCHHRIAAIGAPPICPRCVARGDGGFEMLPVPMFGRLARHVGAARPFRLTEVQSWPECREILIEGELDCGSIAEFKDAVDRAVNSDHPHLFVDLDRCDFIDVAAVKLLVVTQEHLSCRGEELIIFGATGQVRRMLEVVDAFDPRVLPRAVDHPPTNDLDGGTLSRLGAPSRTSRELGEIDAFGL